ANATAPDPTGTGQGMGKALYADKALLWVLGQRFEYHLFDLLGQRSNLLSQRRRCGREMLLGNLPERANEGACSREPLVDHDPQSVLIAGKTRFSAKLLRSHVRQSTRHLLPTQEFSRGK